MSVLTEWPREAYEDGAFRDFEPAAAGFMLGNARAMAWAAKLAYETGQPDLMRSVAAAWGFPAIEPFATPAPAAALRGDPDTRGFVAAGPHATLIGFAGTDPLLLPNWITNLDFRKTDGSGGRVHAGFRQAAAAALPLVAKALTRHHDGSRPIHVIGHSQGAALALLTAVEIESGRAGAVSGVFLLGMPRVGDDAFAAACGARLGGRIYRLVYGRDIVPCVPLAADGYRHVGRLLRCDSGGRFAAETLSPDWTSNEPELGREVLARLLERRAGVPPASWPTTLRGLPERIAQALVGLLPAALRDHLPDSYIAACGKH